MKRFLVLGGSGMLGSAVERVWRENQKTVTALSRAQCNICDQQAVRAAVAVHEPTIIINCTGHTRVDACEKETDQANAINGSAVGALGRIAEEFGARVVHFSTDFVFDGSLQRPLREQDEPAPLSAYGRSKLRGEQELLQAAPGHALVVRTAWLFGYPGASFPRTIAERAAAGATLRVVDDQIGSPTFTDDLARATLELVTCGATGTIHVANSGQASWLEVARATLELAGIRSDIQPTTSAAWQAQHPGIAVRPAYSVLDTTRAQTILGHRLRPWQEGLADFVKQWRAGSAA